jgi:hypothetical protein
MTEHHVPRRDFLSATAAGFASTAIASDRSAATPQTEEAGLDRKVVSFASCVRLAIGSGRVVRVGKSRRGWCAEERRSSPGGGRGWDVQDWACRRRGDAGRGSRDSSQGINGCGRAPKKRSAAVVPSGRVAR